MEDAGGRVKPEGVVGGDLGIAPALGCGPFELQDVICGRYKWYITWPICIHFESEGYLPVKDRPNCSSEGLGWGLGDWVFSMRRSWDGDE